jgi:hypothetical protein
VLCASINKENRYEKILFRNDKGRTLESRNLRELLARAVNEKRKSDRILPFQPYAQVPIVDNCLTASAIARPWSSR